MRLLAFLCILFLAMSFATCPCKQNSGELAANQAQNPEEVGCQQSNQSTQQNNTQQNGQENNQSIQQQNQTGNQEQNQVTTQNQGMPEQVHAIIQERQNGSITVPQGMTVRIVAQNHVMNVENESFQFNETLWANFQVQGKNKSLILNPVANGIELIDENITVVTNETIDLYNESFYVGQNKLIVMPSSVPGKIQTQTINSAVLHLSNGELLYEVNATKVVKFLWLFDSNMGIEVTVNAETGDIKEEKKPWWAFLASEN
ncbi:hypothetical protein KKB44_00235 [Candidatus Micrarchaeota archaeon]|nr:hypothetical protein [Candidatus Micrarchaeota archaeon]